jgi:hypothetical protein
MGLYGAYRKWLGMVYGMFGFQNIKGPNVDFCVWLKSETKNVSNFPPYLWRVAIDWTSVCYCTHSHWELMVRWSPRPAIVTMTCWRVVMCIYIYTYPPEPTTQFKKWAKIEKHTYCVMKRKGYLGIICYNTNIYIDSEYIYIELVHGFIL